MDKIEERDTRMVCKYGSKCYQKNPAHFEKYKHPKRKLDQGKAPMAKRKKIEIAKETISDSENDSNSETIIKKPIKAKVEAKHPISTEDTADKESYIFKARDSTKTVPNSIDEKLFIKEKFLVEMPDDFYKFWDFCKEINVLHPENALEEIDLQLVGPFDVLAQKFCNKPEPSPEEYLFHWRYYYDPPEFQTVLKGDNSKGFHIGYFRDDPKELPIFLASNCAKIDGVLKQCGCNIFAAVSLYLEDFVKSADVFKKMAVSKLHGLLRKFAQKENIALTLKNDAINKRDRKVVTKTFNRIGLVVPYDKKTQLGYRELAMDNKGLKTLFGKLKDASEQHILNYLSDLQPVITYASIAADECDFGTGLELGLNIMAFGLKCLDKTAITFLTNSYTLLKRDEFAKIAKAHMENRRKGSELSIII
ncbi:PREDICTED: UPF0609 protein C4orf27 homolog [Nicrophorus vespilloides]|uniref:UPF0609 protein C4orf27 homolog n=1 Tax=Nicrophorus vespilloides TaxID=110193 RepID=A0ABM1NHC3_NICVS|nr:PREDICTED: UPF0609 protein C4orf27 homolog [Nicrophorus vespilloides]